MPTLSGSVFFLKENDTSTITVTLKDPDGTAHDLSNADTVYMHITRPDGIEISGKTMSMANGGDSSGVVTYTFLDGDWDADTGLVAGPTLPLAVGDTEAFFECEAVGPSPLRISFPNDAFDTLRITSDIGTGA